MKKPTTHTIDAVVIFLSVAFTAHQLSLPEPPLVEEAVLEQFLEEYGQDKAISIVHLAERHSEITKRQISELNRLHQRHDHLNVVAAVNNEDYAKGPCLIMTKAATLSLYSSTQPSSLRSIDTGTPYSNEQHLHFNQRRNRIKKTPS